MNRRWLGAVLSVLAVACGGHGEGAPKGESSKRKAPETIEAAALKAPKTLSYIGTVVAPRDATLSSTRGGRVEAYAFDVGKSVRTGDVLVKLGSSELSFASQAAAASASQAAARIAGIDDPANLPSALSAKAALDNATDAARRAEKLHAQGSVSEQELARTKTNTTAAKAEYDAALAGARAEFVRLQEVRAMAGQARAALGDAAIRAPFDGIVLDRFVEIGQVAAPNAPLVRVIDPSELRVRFDVPQFDADKVVLGRRVVVSFHGKELGARVVRSTPGLVGEAHARMVEAVIEGAGDATLLPGTRVPAGLETGEDEDLVAIPSSATTRMAGLSRAWVVDGNRLDERLLSVARFEGSRVLVRRGIRPGEHVVKAPQTDFRFGEELQP